MTHATPAQVRRAFLKACFTYTKSLSLVRECRYLFNTKQRPEIDKELELS